MAKKDRKIEWVSYDGEYPNLCSGTLTLKIDGKRVTFSYDTDKSDYPRFWSSGGSWWIDNRGMDHVREGDWYFHWSSEHDWLSSGEKAKIEELFQKKVPKGCCGGCI